MRYAKGLVFASASILIACSSSDGADGPSAGGGADAAGQTDAGAEATGTSNTDGGAGPIVATCALKPMGAVETDGGAIIYQNAQLTATASHARESGCVNTLQLQYSIDGGCKLDLDFQTQEGVWILVDATFAGDSKCGPAWPGEPQTYALDLGHSVGSVMGLSKATSPAQESSCAAATGGKVVGYAAFVHEAADPKDNKYLSINFNGLGLDGGLTTTAVDSAACPVEPRLCQGVECGQDFFGAECGGCDAGFSCAGGTCQVGGCLPAGDGDALGDHIADQTWTESTGESFNLHSQCGQGAVWIIQTASW